MMFEPNEDEARRAEALSQAVMSTQHTSPNHGPELFGKNTERILDRAARFETYLRQGGEIELPAHGNDLAKRPTGAFSTYKDRGLDGGS